MTFLIRMIVSLAMIAMELLDIMLLIYVVMSWVQPASSSGASRFLRTVLQPLLMPIRMFIARVIRQPLPIDISPIVLWVLMRMALNILNAISRFLL